MSDDDYDYNLYVAILEGMLNIMWRDSDNLERVPEFLRGLLRFYNSIYLATHLEDLKCCTDKHIFIKRDEDGLFVVVE